MQFGWQDILDPPDSWASLSSDSSPKCFLSFIIVFIVDFAFKTRPKEFAAETAGAAGEAVHQTCWLSMKGLTREKDSGHQRAVFRLELRGMNFMSVSLFRQNCMEFMLHALFLLSIWALCSLSWFACLEKWIINLTRKTNSASMTRFLVTFPFEV